jgi:hypothetical protein
LNSLISDEAGWYSILSVPEVLFLLIIPAKTIDMDTRIK